MRLPGFPYPENTALASHLESVVRANGGVPATIGILNGVAHIGFEAEELIELTASAGNPQTRKASRRDLSYLCGVVSRRHRQRRIPHRTIYGLFTRLLGTCRA